MIFATTLPCGMETQTKNIAAMKALVICGSRVARLGQIAAIDWKESARWRQSRKFGSETGFLEPSGDVSQTMASRSGEG